MEAVTELLRPHIALVIVWRVIASAAAAFLVSVGVVAIVRPAAALRFFGGYVSSPRTNFIEAALRVCAGLGFMGASPDMSFSAIFFWFGALLSATGVPMMFLYKAHRRYADWAMPLVRRILPLYGLLSLTLGGFCAWALI